MTNILLMNRDDGRSDKPVAEYSHYFIICGIMALATLLSLCGSTGYSQEKPATKHTSYQLKNGLRVILRPIKGAKDMSLIVLFNIGNDHDPKGKSGLAHMVEHCYVTSAAGNAPARTARDIIRRYPNGWNAQTGDRYTVIATTFPRNQLDKELHDAANRMQKLRIEREDLLREKPRIYQELTNMFGNFPPLACMNNAREAVYPSPRDGRKGGVIEHVKKMTLEDVQNYWQAYYRPNNAILILAGDFDTNNTKQRIQIHFKDIPKGKTPPKPADHGNNQSPKIKEISVKSNLPNAQSHVCIAIRAPKPDSPQYPAFLILASRLQAQATKEKYPFNRFPVRFALLDEPEVLYIHSPVEDNQKAKDVIQKLQQLLDKAVTPKLSPQDKSSTKKRYGIFLGLTQLPDQFFVRNPYLPAFSTGRRIQLGIEPQKLGKAIDQVTDEDFRKMIKEVTGSSNRVTISLRVSKKK